MAKAIHMMIRVLDEDRSVRFYQHAFELEVADRFEFEKFVLLYLRNSENDFEIELTVNKGRTERYEMGNGYGHVAFTVDDLEALHSRLQGLGCAPGEIKELHREANPLARYFFLEDPDGYKIEVLQRRGRYR